jgi:hypothetical protein
MSRRPINGGIGNERLNLQRKTVRLLTSNWHLHATVLSNQLLLRALVILTTQHPMMGRWHAFIIGRMAMEETLENNRKHLTSQACKVRAV